jgi:hypothetical protein
MGQSRQEEDGMVQLSNAFTIRFFFHIIICVDTAGRRQLPNSSRHIATSQSITGDIPIPIPPLNETGIS